MVGTSAQSAIPHRYYSRTNDCRLLKIVGLLVSTNSLRLDNYKVVLIDLADAKDVGRLREGVRCLAQSRCVELSNAVIVQLSRSEPGSWPFGVGRYISHEF
jgi:hypothetical protein